MCRAFHDLSIGIRKRYIRMLIHFILNLFKMQNLAVVLVDFLGEALGPHFTPEARQSWTMLLKVMTSIIGESLKSQ